MKIIHVTRTNAGGLTAYFERLLSNLTNKKDIENIIIQLDRQTSNTAQKTTISKQEDYLNAETYIIKNIKYSATDSMIRCRNIEIEQIFSNLCDDLCPDIVHFHAIDFFPFGLFYMLNMRGIKTILTFHDSMVVCQAHKFFVKTDGNECIGPNSGTSCVECFENDTFETSVLRYNYIINTLNNYCDALIAVSEYMRNLHAANGITKRIDLIKTGYENIQLVKEKKINEKINVLFCGRLNFQKGILILLEALKGIDTSKYKLNVYGEGSQIFYNNVLKKHYGDINFEYHGKYEKDEIDGIYDMSDILVIPSIGTENAPLTQMEAYARKVPCVVSSAGGISEYIIKDASVIFEKGNISMLHGILNDLIHNPQKIQKMSDNINIENLKTYDEIADEHIVIYKRVLKISKKYHVKPINREYADICLSKGIRVHIDDVIKLIVEEYNKNLALDTEYFIFGTGSACKRVRKTLKTGKLIGFFDNNESLYSTQIDDLTVCSPYYRENTKVIIASIWTKEISAQLINLGYNNKDLLKVFGN